MRRWRALAGMLWRADRARTSMLAAVTVVQGLLPMGIVLAAGMLVAVLPDAVRQGSSGAESRAVYLWLGLVVTGFAAQSVLEAWAGCLAFELDDRYYHAVHEAVAAATLGTRGVAGLEQPEVAGMLASLEEIERTGEVHLTAQTLRSIVKSRLSGLLAAGVLVTLAWWVVLLALFGIRVFNAAYARWVAEDNERGATTGATTLRRARYLRTLTVDARTAKEVRTFGLADWLLNGYTDGWLRAMRDVWRGRGATGVSMVGNIAVFGAAFGGCLGWLAWLAAGDRLSAAEAVVYVQALFAMGALGVLGDLQQTIDRSLLAAERVVALRERLSPAGTELPSPAGASAEVPARGPAEVLVDDLWFTYADQRRPTLAGLSLHVAAGQSLAIVGENGAGKSTLAKLLCGLYEPDRGRILVDGSADLATARRRTAVVFQDFPRYELTLRDNIGFGSLALSADETQLRKAIAAAGAEDLPAELPAGWDTVLASGYENGQELSGGQWQKVALARALLAVRAGAGLLVLDEPTASLDVRAEAELFDRLLDTGSGVTTILITHRLASVRRADRIVVVADGRIAEAGTHDELMAAGGRYATMFALQASRFSDAAPAVGHA